MGRSLILGRFGRVNRVGVSVLFCLALLAAMLIPPAVSGAEITVSAASSLTNAFREIGQVFEAQHKGTRIFFNFGASGDLLRQIESGAPVDVFASAAPREIDQLDSKGIILSGTKRIFARNTLLLIAPARYPGSVHSFEDLKRAEVKRIAIGNPSSVPAGMYAEEALKYYGVWDDTKEKLVFGESVRQVLDYVARGEVDAGLVFSTDARLRAKELVIVAETSEDSHRLISYPTGVVKGSKNLDMAKAFVQFVCGSEAQKILKAYGFKIP